MFNRVLVIMFAVLFASQTIAAAFDFHSAHQERDSNQTLTHRTIDESHKSHQEGALTVAQIELVSDAENTEQNPLDCHHCCHCHAPSVVYIACNSASNLLSKGHDSLPARKTALLSLWLAPEHRPPIA